MKWTAAKILDVLDEGAEKFTFPSLDNGYVYLAATRLSAFRSADDWALVLQVFGYSPREGVPSIHVTTFGSALRKHHAFVGFQPVADGDWMEDCDYVAKGATTISLRRREVAIPARAACREHGVKLEEKQLQIFELCRYLASLDREAILATEDEERTNVRAGMRRVLRLDEWHHPDITSGERPSDTETFRQVAEVLATGKASRYRPSERANTHWQNWPDGGSL